MTTLNYREKGLSTEGHKEGEERRDRTKRTDSGANRDTE